MACNFVITFIYLYFATKNGSIVVENGFLQNALQKKTAKTLYIHGKTA
jgi:hypothetical protein